MAKKASNRRRTRISVPMVVLITVLLVAVGWQLRSLRAQVAQAQSEKDRYAAQVAAQKQENELLSADLAEGFTQKKVEEIARDELGLVTPGEYVFQERN